MKEKQAWREALGYLISEPYERKRIADSMGINPATLTRWVNGKSDPRRDMLRLLLDALPQYAQELKELIGQEYPDFLKKVQEAPEEVEVVIPSAFYASVLHAYTSSPPILRKSIVETFILHQLESQIDPQRKGITIGIIQCVPPKLGQKVRSLRVLFHRSTMVATQLIEHQTLFLGAESQAGYALIKGYPSIMQNEADILRMFPMHHFLLEKSAVAYPILFNNSVAGSLYISSTEANYFTPASQSLIRSYVNLIVLSFEFTDFYHFDDIALSVMPSQCVQRPVLATIQPRVMQKLLMAMQDGRAMTRLQAEYLVWQELEDEFYHLAVKADLS